MRTEKEIIERLALVQRRNHLDLFGAETTGLIMALSWEAAKPLLKEDADRQSFEDARYKCDEDVEADILDYLPFAWEKASGCRGLSANRSMDHMRAWLWLLGEDKLVAFLENYTHYGKSQLAAISERYGFPWRDHDRNGWRRVDESSKPETAEQARVMPPS